MKSLKIWQKLGLVALLMGVPVVVLIYLFVQSRNEQIVSTQYELVGVEYMAPLAKVIEQVPQHRTAASAILNGDSSWKAHLTGIQQQIDTEFQHIEIADSKHSARLGTSRSWAAIKARWRDLKEKNLLLSARDSFDQHTKLMADLLDLLQMAGDKSNLITDPELDTYYLAAALISHLSFTSEYAGQLAGLGTGATARQKLTGEEITQMNYLARQVSVTAEQMTRHFQAAIRYNGSLDQRLSPILTSATAASSRFTQSVTRDLQGGSLRQDTKSFLDQGNAVLSEYAKLWETSRNVLQELLQQRVARLHSERITQLSIAGIILLLAIGAVYWVSSGITKQVKAMTGLFSRIGVGDYKARCEVHGSDELGTMARSLNSMLDNTLVLIQSREERDQIQGSIRKLLEEVSCVAEGDLSKEAEVTADVTGAIADSFNFMIAELRQLIGQVQQTTRSVTGSAGQVSVVADTLAQSSEEQSRQILEASTAIEQMTAQTQQVSRTATSAATVAAQALESAQQGSETVTKTIDGMNSIRTHVQETAKRIKRLGESSQEIGEIVQLIRDIADRTSILALNASIQAAMAGEQGKGFAVVAEEVERLAERAAESTKRIASLIQSVQTDTNEAISAMEETTREVVGGSQMANEAGQSLQQIEQVSRQIAELVQSIHHASDRQAQDSVVVSRNVTGISEVTQQTAAGARQAAAAIRRLASLAEELNHSVSRFRLPEDSGVIAA